MKPLELAYTALARMAAAAGDGDAALQATHRGLQAGVAPKLRGFTPALLAYAVKGQVEHAFQVYLICFLCIIYLHYVLCVIYLLFVCYLSFIVVQGLSWSHDVCHSTSPTWELCHLIDHTSRLLCVENSAHLHFQV